MKRLSLALSVLFLSLSAYAQLTVSGTVLSADDDSPVPFANFLILNTSLGTTADAAGSFTLPLPSPGTSDRARFTIRVSAVGFKTDTLQLGAGEGVILKLRRDADLPTVTVSGGEYHPLKELRYRKYLPNYMTAWGDKVATCYKKSGKKQYQLRLLGADGVTSRFDLDIGKINGITSHCSDLLYILTDGFAVSFDVAGDSLRPIERIPLNDFRWLFADCRDAQDGAYLYEKKRLRGMNKLYLLLDEDSQEQLIREYLDSALVHEYFYGVPIMDFDWVETKQPPMWWSANGKGRRAQAMAHFDQHILYNNHNDNAIFFAGEEIILVNFDEGLVETFAGNGERVGVVPFDDEVDARVTLDQRIFRDAISGKTFALARDNKGHRLYHFDADTGDSRMLFRLDVEQVEELVVLNDRFYLLARQDRFGPESARRIYEGILDE